MSGLCPGVEGQVKSQSQSLGHTPGHGPMTLPGTTPPPWPPSAPLEDPPAHVGPTEVTLRVRSSSPVVTFGSMDIHMRDRTMSMGTRMDGPNEPTVGPRGAGRHRGGFSVSRQGSGSLIGTHPTSSPIGTSRQDTGTGGGAKGEDWKTSRDQDLERVGYSPAEGITEVLDVVSDVRVSCSQSADRKKAEREVPYQPVHRDP